MKVRNKQTGEINILKVDEDYFKIYKDDGEFVCPVTLKELNEGWEDYEEPKEYYFIRDDGSAVGYSPIGNSPVAKRRKEIGNYFETKEEAEKAVEKLKAWKRLKDKGFVFEGYILESGHNKIIFDMFLENNEYLEKAKSDLDLIFGGKNVER